MQPMGTAIVVQAAPRPPRKNFNKKGQMICGAIQIVMGFLSLVVGAASMPLKAGGYIWLFGTGLYCSIFMFIAGGVAVRSSITENTCPIIGCIVMSVFSAFSGLNLFSVYCVATSIDVGHKRTHATYDKQYAGSSSIWRTDNPDAALAVDIVAVLVGLTALCTAIALIVISSRTTCCTTQPQQQLVYVQQPYPGQANAGVSQQGYVVVGAPPPYGEKPTMP